MGLLDDILSFNRDGKSDITVKIVGTALAAMILDDAAEEEGRADDISMTLSFFMRGSNVAEEDA